MVVHVWLMAMVGAALPLFVLARSERATRTQLATRRQLELRALEAAQADLRLLHAACPCSLHAGELAVLSCCVWALASVVAAPAAAAASAAWA